MTSPELSQQRENFCYRHPDRPSFVLCQRCGRTVCPECQTLAPVGVICPECIRESNAKAKAAQRPSARTRLRRLGQDQRPLVTYAIIGVSAVLWLIQQVTGDWLTGILVYHGIYSHVSGGAFEPWRMLTSAFAHSTVFHLAFNMLTLWIFGRTLEQVYGHLRFAALYVVSALGGSLAIALVAPNTTVLGASGAVFGLFGAYFVVMRQARMNTMSLIVLIGINVVMGFVIPGIAWQAHLGGLVTGALCSWLFLWESKSEKPSRQGLWLVAALGVLIIVGATASVSQLPLAITG